MGERDGRRVVAGVILAGAVLAAIGNALHPFLDPGAPVEDLLATVGAHGSWQLLHLTIAVAVVLLGAGLVLVCRWLADTAGGTLAGLAAVFAMVGATLFAIQIGGVDGAAMPALAEGLELADDPAAVLAAASALLALDRALLGLVVTIYFGALFLTLGLALVRAGAFAPWLRWSAVAAGVTGVVVGPMMVLGVAEDVAFLAFRAVAAIATVVAFGLAVQLYRGTAVPTSRSSPASTPVG